MLLQPVIERIEGLARNRPFGQLPQLRKRLKNIRQAHKQIFYFVRSPNTPKTELRYAFHWGGRRELQFNLGLEDSGHTLRYGVAFSFQGNRNLTNLGVLRPSVDRFNDFVKRNPAYLSRFLMWTYEPGRGRTERLAVRPISGELFRWGVFVFVGSTQPARTRSIDYGRILEDLDWLIALYEFVEGGGKTLPVKHSKAGFAFKPGSSIQTFSARATLSGKTIEIDLRQKRIQDALHGCLVSRFGAKNVGTELSIPKRFVDLAVRKGTKLWYYEVKTSQSVQQCIREALGQLLEYSYWPGLRKADRLIIVGEEAPTAESRKYISILRKRFEIPVEYQQFDLSNGELILK
jgi:hypothetical protein